MNFFKNQRGVSLIEALIGISITAAAGVAYMTHTQTVAKNEAKQKVRASIDILNAQAVDYLKSRDVCNENISKAFANVPLNGTNVNGDQDYKALKNKGFKDAQGVVQSKSIFTVGDVYDGGKVHVSDVSYKLSELVSINQQSSPWTKTGKIKIAVELETCKDGGPVVFKSDNGVIQERCPANMRQKQAKTFEKFAAFKTNASGMIENFILREKILQPNGTWQWVPVGERKNLACADSQDALVEAAAQYTDIKVCINELKMMMLAGKLGMTECGIELGATEKAKEYTSGTSIPLPTGYMPNSLVAELLGAGGGGGSGGGSGDGQSGRGGKAGSYVKQILANAQAQCTLTIGVGGAAGTGGRGGNGGNGGESRLSCGDATPIVAAGGAGGEARGNGQNNCGTAGDNSPKGAGSGGNCRKSGNSQPGGIGAGGGGGGESGRYENGKAGGGGWAKLSWKTYTINDPDQLLMQQGLTPEALINNF